MKLKQHQIKVLKDYLNGKWVDRYVETGAINVTISCLGYDGHFEFNYDTNKVKWVAK